MMQQRCFTDAPAEIPPEHSFNSALRTGRPGEKQKKKKKKFFAFMCNISILLFVLMLKAHYEVKKLSEHERYC